jgi:glucose-1-phosphate adenylyltransferase
VGSAVDSAIAPGVVISGATVSNSVLSPRVRVHSFSKVSGSVLLDNVVVNRHCVVKNAIVDKNVVLPEGTEIGVDHDADRARGFTVTDSGLVVIGKGTVLDPVSGAVDPHA